MVLQFRVMDFGMEHCTLMGAIPSAADLERSSKSVPVVSSETAKIEVWFLDDNDVQLNAETLSYSKRPHRRALAGVWGATTDQRVPISDAFECPSRSLLTFEFVCTEPGCYMHFTQDEEEPIMGPLCFLSVLCGILRPLIQPLLYLKRRVSRRGIRTHRL